MIILKIWFLIKINNITSKQSGTCLLFTHWNMWKQHLTNTVQSKTTTKQLSKQCIVIHWTWYRLHNIFVWIGTVHLYLKYYVLSTVYMYFKCLWYMYIVNIYMPSLKNLETVPNLLVKYFDFLSPFSKEDLKKKNIFFLATIPPTQYWKSPTTKKS